MPRRKGVVLKPRPIRTANALAARLADIGRRICADRVANSVHPVVADTEAEQLVCGMLHSAIHDVEVTSGLLNGSAREEVQSLLRLPATDLPAVIADFARRHPDEDPAIHFYELFLRHYDSSRRKSRGVYYTPRPVASFIVRSVHRILQTDFALPDGLADTAVGSDLLQRFPALTLAPGANAADPFVQILDPAAGTGVFLVEVIDVIHRTLRDKWRALGHSPEQGDNLWRDYVPRHLLPRLHGHELMPAACAAARLQIVSKLRETGYRVQPSDEIHLRVINSLTTVDAGPSSHETRAIDHRDAIAIAEQLGTSAPCIFPTVIVGNPPYAALSANLSPQARRMIDPYRYVDGQPIRERSALQFEKNLNDDYVKFFRLAESLLEPSVGVAGLITNNGYLNAATLRGMRSHLLETFDDLRILNLHGDADRRERADDGSPDENVFATIKRGVAIAILSRRTALRMHNSKGQSFHADLRGTRTFKLDTLRKSDVSTIPWKPLAPRPASYRFAHENIALANEYAAGVSIADLFDVRSTGFESGRDDILTHFTREELTANLRHFATAPLSQIEREYDVSNGWGKTLLAARKTVAADPDFSARIRPFLFAPFDIRYCYYRKEFLKTNSFSAARHLLYSDGANLALIVMRQVSLDAGFSHVGVTRVIPNNRCFYSTRGKITYFPLYLHEGQNDLVRAPGRRIGCNLRDDRMQSLATRLALRWQPLGVQNEPETTLALDHNLCVQNEPEATLILDHNVRVQNEPKAALTPEHVMHYIVAQLHDPGYRDRYAELLKTDFPRIFWPRDRDEFLTRARQGATLVALHLQESSFLPVRKLTEIHAEGSVDSALRLLGPGPTVVEPTYPRFRDHRIYLNPQRWFSPVSVSTWQTRIGGYPVCRKWLKDRTGRPLNEKDVTDFEIILNTLEKM